MTALDKIRIERLQVWYGGNHAVKGVSLAVMANEILGIIGPANSGKTSFLRTLNRMNDLLPHFRMEGDVFLDGKNIYQPGTSISDIRRTIGMVFALPVPLPLSIYDNLAYGPRLYGVRGRGVLDGIIEKSLRAAYLWDEVKDRLSLPAQRLSGGQQQRLCIARTLALEPEVILYDEPCSGLDPISTAKVEETMIRLKEKYTIVLVTNNTKQAARVSDRTAFFLMGELVEIGTTGTIFTAPTDKRTEEFVSGKFG